MRAKIRNRLKVVVDKAEFVIQEDRKLGYATITYNRYTDEKTQEGLQVKFRLLTCWVDPEKQVAIKAHLLVNKENPMHVALLRDIAALGIVPATSNFCLTSDGTLIRYGKQPDHFYSSQNDETYKMERYYDSKAQALNDILTGLQRFQTVGGLNMVSLGRLPDSVLVETGYKKIPDTMMYGVPMWCGVREDAVAGQNGWDTAGAKRSARQFLDLIAKSVNA